MKNLENLGIVELQAKESRTINGGGHPAIWIGIGIGLAVIGIYDFLNGVYAGIKQELAKEPPVN